MSLPLQKNIAFYYTLLFIILPSTSLWAQNHKDTLKTVRITAPKLPNYKDLRQNFINDAASVKFDSIILNFYQSQSLSDLIAEQSPVFVKSYGVNSMSTLSIRGASAAQSVVLWEGIPINNTAMGLADISLLKTGLFNNIRLQYGGSSALFGSGNIGGALLLSDKDYRFIPGERGVVNLGIGSFGRHSILAKGQWENHLWHFDFKAFFQRSKNNFPYQSNNGITERMPNALLKGGGGILSVAYNVPHKQNEAILKEVFSLEAWLQQYDREIPPALFESLSVKNQGNFTRRTLLSWRQIRKRSTFYAKASFNKDYLRYRDGVVLPNNENTAHQWYFEAGWQWWVTRPKKSRYWQQKILLFTPVIYAFAQGENLSVHKTQFRPALTAAYQLQSNDGRYQANIMLRQSWWTGHPSAWLPGFNAEANLLTINSNKNYFSLSLLGNVQKSFRIPNLNELYFSPGGNPNLKPERGWNESGGWIIRLGLNQKLYHAHKYTWEFTHHGTFFNRSIRDWIYWLGGAIWTPHNLAKVHSRGVETANKVQFRHNSFALTLGIRTAYVLATTTASYLPHDGSIGKQIPYTPRYNVSGNLSLRWRHLLVNYNHGYTGYRFMTTDESEYLLPYQLGHLQIAYSWPMSNFKITLLGQLSNVWNKHYTIVKGRPMPGRSFLLSLKGSWQH